jgi:HlyD family secretion protein
VQDLEASVEATTYSISVVESSLESAEADIERAEDALANTLITAPMDGMVTLLNVEAGEVVTGSTTNPGTVLMTIADLSRMVHMAEVAESDIANVTLGQRAKLHINAYPDEVFSGSVRQIAWQRTASPDGTGHFETEIAIDLQGGRIRSGHRANAEIEIKTHDGLVVPRQAIVVRELENLPESVRQSDLIDQTKTKANVIFQIVDGKAVCTPVRAGASDLTHRLVLEGLEGEETIVVGPYKVLETISHEERVQREGEGAKDQDTTEGGDTDQAEAVEEVPGDDPEAVDTSSPATGAAGGEGA